MAEREAQVVRIFHSAGAGAVHRRGRLRAVGYSVMAVAAATGLSVLMAASSSAAGTWTAATASLSGLNPTAGVNPDAFFGKVVGGATTEPVACPAAGSCVAVGSYTDGAGNLQGLIETQSSGTWTAQTAPLTGLNPAANTNPSVYFYALSCPAAGSCVAVGSYDDASFNQYGLIETLSNGTWTGATAPTSGLNPSAHSDPSMTLTGLSCPTTGSCVAVGTYNDALAGVIETQSSGTWTATAAPLSGLSTTQGDGVQLFGLSCPTVGWCVAGGQYQDSSNNYQGLLETLSAGTWKAAGAPTGGLSPAASINPQALLSDVSCPAQGWCVAVGAYDASSGTQGLIETLSGGTWTAATAPTSGLSPGAASPPGDPLFTVSCPASGSCVAVSTYHDNSSNTDGLIETLSGGNWTAATAPTSGLSPGAGPTVTIGGQACPATGSCVAVGSYTDGSGYQHGLIETQSAGTWTAQTAPLSGLSPAAATNPMAILASVSCPATGPCTAVGDYQDSSSDKYGLIETQTAPSPVTCTWTDSDHTVNDNWSNGSNWSGQGCTSTGGPPAGAAIVFPSGLSNPGVSYDSGSNSSFDSITFEAPYTVSEVSGAPTLIALTPTAATPCGSSIGLCDTSTTGKVTFAPGVTLGSPEEVATVPAATLFLEGIISGSHAILIGDSTNTGSVFLEPGGASCSSSNSYSGPTTVRGGDLYLECSNSLPSGTAVSVESGAVLSPELLSGGTVANDITDNGTVDSVAWTGQTQTLSGVISGSGTFSTVNAAPDATTVLTGNNAYSGGTTVAPGTTLLDEPASTGTDPLGASAGAVTVDHSASLALNDSGHSMSVSNPLIVGDGTAGTALVLDQTSFDYWTGAVTLVSGTTDELADSQNRGSLWVTGVIGGLGTLTSGDAANTTGFVALEPGGAGSCVPNTYSGGTVVVDLLEAFCAAAPGRSSAPVTIDASGKFFWTLSASGSVSYNVTDNGAYYIYPGTGTTTTLTGNVSGYGFILASGDMGSSATTVLAGTDDPTGGTVVAPNGSQGTTLDVTGSTGAVTVRKYCTLQGSGTVGAITSSGTVQPGLPPGNLTTSATATLASGGTGSLAIDITGASAGSGYSQLLAAGSATLTNATLSIADSYAAPYGTVFKIVSAGSISGTFANAAQNAVLTAGGRQLQIGYSSNAVTLTDVTNAQSPPPPPTGPTVSAISPAAGSTAGGTAVTITGTGLTGATAVAFGSTPAASFKVVSDTEITAVSPAGISGPVDVEVTTPSGTSAAVAADQFSYRADFTGVAPSRICDTRSGNPSALSGGAAQCNGKTLAANTPLTVNVGGLGGVPGAGVSAVVLNVTVTNPAADGYLTVYPAGQSAPLASNLNFSAGETVANLVKVGLSKTGQITVVTNAMSADVIVDVEGYVSALPTAGQGLYDGLTPARICDTRSSSLPVNQCTGKTMKPNSTMTVQVAGLGGVPANAKAVAVNVTVTDTTAASYLTVFPGGARPTASNLNWASGRTVPNLVVVELNSSGGLTLYNHAGTTDVVLDVLGYYTAAGGSGTQFNALAEPVRICDSRSGSQPSNQCTGKTMAQNSTMVVQVTGLAGVPADAQAVVLNVTATNPSASSYLTVYPGGTRPLASNLNWTSGQTVPNLVVGRLSSSGQVTLYNYTGSTDVVVDVMGWYS